MGLLDDKYVGNKGLLNTEELVQLDNHLQEVTYGTAKEIIEFIKGEFNETYSLSGVHELLKRMGFVYKKPHRLPAKLNLSAQETFIKYYHRLSKKLGTEDHLCFMDTTHP